MSRPYDASAERPIVALVIVGVFATLLACVFSTSCTHAPEGGGRQRTYPTMDALTYTYTNDKGEPPVYVYVVRDPDTGRQYLVTDRGGITPRLD